MQLLFPHRPLQKAKILSNVYINACTEVDNAGRVVVESLNIENVHENIFYCYQPKVQVESMGEKTIHTAAYQIHKV